MKIFSLVGIGFSESPGLKAMPGVAPNSWGLHSDDGKAYQCRGATWDKKSQVSSRIILHHVGKSST